MGPGRRPTSVFFNDQGFAKPIHPQKFVDPRDLLRRSGDGPVIRGDASGLAALHRLVRNRTGGKSAFRQWVEMVGLFVLRGNGPNFYQMAGFWRRDQQWATMAGHLSYRQFKAQIDALNPPPYHKLSQNKLAEKAIMTLMGIPTPRFLGLLDRECGRDTTGAPLCAADDLVRLLSRDAADRVCFKLVEGNGGKGFVAVDILRDGAEPRFRPLQALKSPSGSGARDRESYSASELVARLGNEARVIESYLEQHPAYAALNPTSVNTMRIWVLRQAGKTSAKLGYLRVGRAGSLVDNHHAGGIVVPIDLSSGRLSVGSDGRATGRTFPVHPDHGATIEGTVLPMWAEARALAERCLTVFPYMNFAGMDVAMTPTGPAILEANVQPSRNGAAQVGIPTREIFGI